MPKNLSNAEQPADLPAEQDEAAKSAPPSPEVASSLPAVESAGVAEDIMSSQATLGDLLDKHGVPPDTHHGEETKSLEDLITAVEATGFGDLLVPGTVEAMFDAGYGGDLLPAKSLRLYIDAPESGVSFRQPSLRFAKI